nr:MAG: internal scaffolding protein [Microvirus Sku121]
MKLYSYKDLCYKSKHSISCDSAKYEVMQYVEPYAKNATTGEFINDTSERKLVKVGVRDLDKEIQELADESDVYKILERAVNANDLSMLNIVSGGVYADITEMPTSPHDLIALKDSLPELNKQMEELKAKMVENKNDNASIEELVRKSVAKILNENKEVQNNG